ncbi:hypothetical protein ACOMHN_065069 [Nucella lapillus]
MLVRAAPLNCSRKENYMTSPDNRHVFVGDNLTLCCDIPQALRDVIVPENVTFYRRDMPLSAAQGLRWTANGSTVCLGVRITEVRRVNYYCTVLLSKYKPAGPGSVEKCLGYRFIRSDERSGSVLDNVDVDCVKESFTLTCTFLNLSEASFAKPDDVQLAVLYRSNVGPNEADQLCTNCTLKQECTCTLEQEGIDFDMYSNFTLNLTLGLTYTGRSADRFSRRVFPIVPRHVGEYEQLNSCVPDLAPGLF